MTQTFIFSSNAAWLLVGGQSISQNLWQRLIKKNHNNYLWMFCKFKQYTNTNLPWHSSIEIMATEKNMSNLADDTLLVNFFFIKFSKWATEKINEKKEYKKTYNYFKV